MARELKSHGIPFSFHSGYIKENDSLLGSEGQGMFNRLGAEPYTWAPVGLRIGGNGPYPPQGNGAM